MKRKLLLPLILITTSYYSSCFNGSSLFTAAMLSPLAITSPAEMGVTILGVPGFFLYGIATKNPAVAIGGPLVSAAWFTFAAVRFNMVSRLFYNGFFSSNDNQQPTPKPS